MCTQLLEEMVKEISLFFFLQIILSYNIVNNIICITMGRNIEVFVQLNIMQRRYVNSYDSIYFVPCYVISIKILW